MFGRRNAVSKSAGPLHTDAAMVQATSGVEWDPVRYLPSCSILGKDAIKIEEEPSSKVSASRPDSWSIHCDRANQAPYVTGKDVGNMMTSTRLFALPQNNDSAQLAFFLKTTGPSTSHRRPTKVEEPKPGVDAPKKMLQFFKLRPKRSKKTWLGAHRTWATICVRTLHLTYDLAGLRYLHVIPKPMEDDPVDGSVRPLVRLEEDKKNEALLLR
ncbi:hypothetical protein LTR56_027364 [Elasticomyces elasticus]|nr:hypothetical protein LTR56_027364 [Elasticomyces elasticus]